MIFYSQTVSHQKGYDADGDINGAYPSHITTGRRLESKIKIAQLLGIQFTKPPHLPIKLADRRLSILSYYYLGFG